MNHRRPALAALVALAFSGCDYPTSAPIVQQQWILPAESTVIGVAQLLPAGVSDNGSAFAVTIPAASQTRSLADLCPPCDPLNGATVPKPAFAATFTDSVSLPADVSSATLSSGSVQVALHNGFDFDPIRPGGGATGTVTVVVTDVESGRQIGGLALDGTTNQLPPGSTTDRTLSLVPGAIGPTVVVTVTLDSPAGDPTKINTSDQFTATASPSSLLISAASVAVAGRSVAIQPTSFDVSGIDQTFIDRVDSGGFTVDVTNPFGVAVNGTLQVAGNGFSPISKSFHVGSDPTSTTTVSFTGGELKQFLGKSNVEISGSGIASAPGPVTIEPGQEIELDAKLDVSLSVGG